MFKFKIKIKKQSYIKIDEKTKKNSSIFMENIFFKFVFRPKESFFRFLQKKVTFACRIYTLLNTIFVCV